MSPHTLEDRVATLERQVVELTAAREQDRQLIDQTTASLQAERDEYLRSLYAWAQQQFSDDDMRDYPEEEGIDFVKFLDELERQRG